MENSTASHLRLLQPLTSSPRHGGAPSDGNAFLYILIVMSFYGVFLCAIMLGYFRSKRREKKRANVFTRLVHDKEKREWGALPKKHSLTLLSPAASSVPGLHSQFDGTGVFPSPLACALCTEHSSASSLCSSVETRVAIEEEDSEEALANDSG